MKDTRLEYKIQQEFFNRCNGYEGNINPTLKKIVPVENAKGAGRGAAGFEYASSIPDTFGHVAVNGFNGAWIEFKRQGKEPSAEQYEKHRELRGDGFAVEWFDNENDAFDFWQAYLNGDYKFLGEK